MSNRRNSIQARKLEERVQLRRCFLQGAETTEEKIIALRDVYLIEKSLELMKVQSLLGFGTKRTGKMAFSRMIDTLLEQELAERYDLGLIAKKQVEITDITDAIYQWTFTHTIRTPQGSKRRNYETRVEASDEPAALALLQHSLKRKKRELVSIDKTRKSLARIVTREGNVYNPYMVDIVENGEVLS